MEKQLEEKVLNVKMPSKTSMSSINGPSYEVAEKLRKIGYDIAGHAGIRKEKPLSSFIGILKDRNPLNKSILGIKYTKKQRAIHLGTLWFNNEKKNANEHKNWVLDVYGRKHLSKMTKLVNSLSQPYNVEVKVNLKSEYPIEENYLSDLI